ncbi:BglG family transcription antiterminator [Clostridium sp. MD294]|uniref:BglG family transcription antiterminator n=1 Tax=Clostridium sp. MD294 TaxID=97138 RepID=UPI0002CB159D|nr:BglG family transcription antiterminator [Clostridium sp. MD294]NDO46305.1 transcription antiterminator [Clostridium sp. MD294]USF29268.1 Transcriptional regulator MtlR [Clostridium sp. MD294]
MSPSNENVNKKTNLTARQKAIIEILTKFTATNPVTISTISEKLKLSSRTILREMPEIERWLSENEFKFIRKPGVGLVLDESLENQKKILKLLDVEVVQKVYSKEQRRKFLLGELLASKEPRKSFYFTSKFKISDGTLSNDLDILGKWLSTYQIKIIRKQGLGIYLEGTEENYRQAIANVVYDFMEEKEILSLLSGCQAAEDTPKIEIYSHNKLLHFLDEKIVKVVEQLLSETEQKLKIKYTDSAYIGLVVHISLAIKRIQNLEKIEMEQQKLQKLLLTPECSVAEEIAQGLSEQLDVEIPVDEIGFITMHLLSAKIWFSDDNALLFDKKSSVKELVKNMIVIVEQILGFSLKENEELYEDLVQHILPAISRLSMNVYIKNTQLQIIKENYKDIFDATEKACVLLKEFTSVKEIPETEIAFIAMHFGAAVEKLRSKQKQFCIAVVCPTGMGTSRMLAANLAKEFHNLEICCILSALHIDTKKLAEEEIDFIVSTVELDVNYTYAHVSPILTEQDKLLLTEIMKKVQKTKAKKPTAVKYTNTTKYATRQDIIYITDIGTEIIQLLNNLRFLVIQQIADIWDIIPLAGRMFTKEKKMADAVIMALKSREMKSETYISSLEIMLFHCKTDVVNHCRFGYIGLRKPFCRKDGTGWVKGAVVMLTPEYGTKVCLEVISTISSALIENEKLITYLHSIHQEAFVITLEQYLGQYYQKCIDTLHQPKKIL